VQRVIYTIGTSTRSIEEFISLCRKFKLQAAVDIRRFPTSKFDHFKKDNLSASLQRRGIKYSYLGDVLGGFRKKGYGQHVQTPEFTEGIEKLKKIASEFRTAFMCAEKFPWRCHRKFVALKLAQDGWKVIHILDEERTWEPQEIPTLFDRDT
jgi:uncharacterized protein (DUF488 family)